VFEIVRRIQIGNEPRLNRSPSQPTLRQPAGGRSVYAKEESDPSKMIGCFLARLADDRYIQMLADDLGDLSSRHALIRHAVISGCNGGFLERESVETSCIDPMHRGPPVEPVAYNAETPFSRAMLIRRGTKP
jgi:hypothetical protein